MITRRSAEVTFHAGVDRSAHLTWGQQGTWDVFRQWLPEMKPFFVLTRWLPVPLLLELDDVLAQLAHLLERHESLRTVFPAGPAGEGSQRVLGRGSVRVEVLDRPDGDPVSFADLVTDAVRQAGTTPFDHETELPIRFTVATHEGVPVLLVFAVSHLAADHLSADLLVDELTDLLRARADGAAAPPARPATQPVDLAAFERSLDGQRLNVDALAHLRRQLARLPAASLPPRLAPASPRYWRGELASAAAAAALRLAARRLRASTSVTLLAITNALVRTVCAGPVYPLDIMQSNRAAPSLRHTVTSLNQAVRLAMDVSGDTFDDLLGHARTAMAAAMRHARHDGRAAARVAAEAPLAAGGQFNDRWSLQPRPAGASPAAADLPGLIAGTTFDWPQTAEAEGMPLYVDASGPADRVHLSLMADTALLAPADICGFLYAVEQVAVELAAGDIDLRRVTEIYDGHRLCEVPGRPAER
ncbi:condensation domain-containing protein [Micromonospora sp. WMMD980]|uniref:condensation domain-containing protein n=1 Tax=Micromonospora sp. WMMD980 TaxID=3016088 RepID=UPI0024177A4F|nr:condensation domain-containing protein [Micromonospora sp. WMMD980]MDG4802025.1 condensation domain-containing protein [Micromonospora sp. WMMD980]